VALVWRSTRFDYAACVLPRGFSWFKLEQGQNFQNGRASVGADSAAKRQILLESPNAMAAVGGGAKDAFTVAMFDEIDEGTGGFFKCSNHPPDGVSSHARIMREMPSESLTFWLTGAGGAELLRGGDAGGGGVAGAQSDKTGDGVRSAEA